MRRPTVMITPYSYSFLFGDLGNGVMDRDVSVNGGPWVQLVVVSPYMRPSVSDGAPKFLAFIY